MRPGPTCAHSGGGRVRIEPNPLVRVSGTGSYLPPGVVDNPTLSTIVKGYDAERSGDFSAWVDQMTHINQRRFAGPGGRNQPRGPGRSQCLRPSVAQPTHCARLACGGPAFLAVGELDTADGDQQVHHRLAYRRRRVEPLTQRPHGDALLAQRADRVRHFRHVAAEAVGGGHGDHVARPRDGQQLGECRPCRSRGRRCLLRVDAVGGDSGCGERVGLGIEGLMLGADSGVAENVRSSHAGGVSEVADNPLVRRGLRDGL